MGVDVHVIPAARGEPVHQHHDLVFFLNSRNDEIRVSQESRAVIWCPLDNLAKYGVDPALRRCVERAVAAD